MNEDEQRRSMVAHSTYGNGGDEKALQGHTVWGLATAYLISRRGAAHIFDFSTMRKCYFRTFSWYMIGVSMCTMLRIEQIARQVKSGENLNLQHRVHQNEQTHSVLRTMKFHLATRQMGLWD